MAKANLELYEYDRQSINTSCGLPLWVDHKLHKAAPNSMEPRGRPWLHGPRGGKKAVGKEFKRERWKGEGLGRFSTTGQPKGNYSLTRFT